jgi:hypothetical protein
VDRTLSNGRKDILAPAIAKQLDATKIDVRESLQFGGWSIIYVDTHNSDDAYLFFASNPLASRPVTMWGGAAARDEERDIRIWTIKNAPGIPPKLANCFAWHVTKDRE